MHAISTHTQKLADARTNANSFNLIPLDFHDARLSQSTLDSNIVVMWWTIFNNVSYQQPNWHAHIHMRTSYANVANNISLFVKKFVTTRTPRSHDATCNKAQFCFATNKIVSTSLSSSLRFHCTARPRTPRRNFFFAILPKTFAFSRNAFEIVSAMHEEMEMLPINFSMIHGEWWFHCTFSEIFTDIFHSFYSGKAWVRSGVPNNFLYTNLTFFLHSRICFKCPQFWTK